MATAPVVRMQYVTGNRRYKAGERFLPQGIVVHSIGVTQPSADALYRYWAADGSAYVTHYVLDDKSIIQCMPDNFKCWHVGSPGNSMWLGVELCEPNSVVAKNANAGTGGGFTVKDRVAATKYVEACYRNVVWLCAQKCLEYGWNPYTAVWTHGEVTRKKLSNTDHVDPHHLWDGLGMGYTLAKLRDDVAAEMKLDVRPSSPAAVPPAPTAEVNPDQIYRIRTAWGEPQSQIGAFTNLEYAIAACKPGYAVYDATGRQVHPPVSRLVRITASALNVRRGPATTYSVVNTLAKGGAYTIVEEVDGWGLLKSYQRDRNGWVSLQYTEPV